MTILLELTLLLQFKVDQVYCGGFSMTILRQKVNGFCDFESGPVEATPLIGGSTFAPPRSTVEAGGQAEENNQGILLHI